MSSAAPMTLAIVDDDDDVRNALHRLLRALGHHVVGFPSAEAFETGAVVVDCVIVDMRLPGLSGLELRDRLRDRTRPTPVVLVTGDADRVAGDLSGATDTPLLNKPFDEATLATAIAQAIAGSSPRNVS
jgi:FixJ family two-component response regulator